MVQTSKPRLYIPIGNIGTGKTTLGECLNNLLSVKVVSYDDISKHFFPNEDFYDVRHEVQEITLSLLSVFIANGRDVYMDETNTCHNRRIAILSSISAYNPDVVFITMPRFSKESAVNNRMIGGGRGFSVEYWQDVYDTIEKYRCDSNIAGSVVETCISNAKIIELKPDWFLDKEGTVLKVAGIV